MPRTVTERPEAVLALATAFRRHGFEGASLNVIAAETGLGRGSLYNFFPGGKEEMAAAVLDEIGVWFGENIYRPLGEDGEPFARLDAMFEATADYFESRELVCLFAAFAIGQERDRFADEIEAYFTNWIAALSSCLVDAGYATPAARTLAVETVSVVHGGLILSRATQDPGALRAALRQQRRRLDLVADVATLTP